MGAAGRAEATQEINFVPHILPCSSWFALGWHGTARHGGAAQVDYGPLHYFISKVAPPLSYQRMETWMQTWGKKEIQIFSLWCSAIIQKQS